MGQITSVIGSECAVLKLRGLVDAYLSYLSTQDGLFSRMENDKEKKKKKSATFEMILVSFSQYGKMLVKVRGSQPAWTR